MVVEDHQDLMVTVLGMDQVDVEEAMEEVAETEEVVEMVGLDQTTILLGTVQLVMEGAMEMAVEMVEDEVDVLEV